MTDDTTQTAAPGVLTRTPHSARVYDYWLGGKDNFAADRAVGDAMIQAIPGLRYMARENRRFVHRAARHLSEQGIRQFLDIGTGIPTSPNLHDIAQQHDSSSRVVYVDNDPIVLAHARALLTGTSSGRVAYVDADLRDPARLLATPALRDTLDLTRPVGLTLIAVLMLIDDTDDPWAAVDQLRDAMPSGSYLALTHPTADFNPAEVQTAVTAATAAGMTLVARTREAVTRFFGDWDLVDSQVYPVSMWRPDTEVEVPEGAYYWAGVARKP